MRENITKLQNMILEHPNADVYFENYSTVDDVVPRIILSVDYIKNGYLFEGLVHENRCDFECHLSMSADDDGRAFNSDLFKDIIRDYFLKHNVEYFEDLEDGGYELIKILADKVEQKYFIIVKLTSIED